MTTMPGDFVVFILTHGRPDNVITLRTLERQGYKGRWFLVCDDEDKRLGEYRARYGDHVLVFNKKEAADACDEGNNFDNRRTILMARNACFDLALDVGARVFLELDDDYYYFGTRDYAGAVKSRVEPMFNAMIRFLDDTGATSVALSQGGDHVGGFQGVRAKRKCMNSFFCTVERPFKFVGALNEDVNTYTTLGSRGHVFLTFTGFQLDQKDTQAQAGGITETYKALGTFAKSFTTVMMMPNAVKVSMMGINNPRMHHSVNWKTCVPCIINERHRKP